MNLKFGECWEISKKDLVRLCQKIRTFSKNCSVKIELLLITKDL